MTAPELTDNTTATIWLLQQAAINEMHEHFRSEMNACIDKIMDLERQLSDTQTRLDVLQKRVIENHERRLGKLDGHEGKDYPHAQRGAFFESLKKAAAATDAERGIQDRPAPWPPGAIPVAGTSGFVDPVFPIPEPTRVASDIHIEEQKVST